MKDSFIKKNGILLAAAILALAGMTIYIITSVTGYLASAAMNPLPIVCTVVAVGMLGAVMFTNRNMVLVLRDALVMASSVLLLVSFYYLILARVQLAADVYFIPVNYPASEAAALHVSIVGAVFYLAADLAVIVMAFSRDKELA